MLPEPVLKDRVDLSQFNPKDKPDAFFRSSAKFGDLNNDGIYSDFIRYNNDNIQAFSYDGNGNAQLLWEYYSPIDAPPQANRNFNQFIVWDIDNDGRTEVVAALPSESGFMELQVRDGQTGTLKSSSLTDIPNPTSSDPVAETRIYLGFADTRGLGQPQDVVMLTVNDSLGDIFVYNQNLAPLWDTTGDNLTKETIYAHYPWIYDIDGDGKDEIIANWVLDDNGSRLWRANPERWAPNDATYDHVDRAFFGDFDPTRAGNEIVISHEYLEATLFDTSGNAIWSRLNPQNRDTQDSKTRAVGNFTNETPGAEVLVNAPALDLNNKHALLDIRTGEVIQTVDEVRDGFNFDWDGDRSTDEIFTSEWGIINDPSGNSGEGLRIQHLYNQLANTQNPLDMRVYAYGTDVLGDYREEAIIIDEDEMLVFGAAGDAPFNLPSPWTNPEYRSAMGNSAYDNHPERDYIDFQNLSTAPPTNTNASTLAFLANNFTPQPEIDRKGEIDIQGTDRADTLIGTDNGDKIDGGRDGKDLIRGLGGDDTIYGADDNSTLEGGSGNDFIEAEDDDDLISGGTGNDTIYASDGRDTIAGNNGNDLIYGEDDRDEIDGGSGDDTLIGGDDRDELIGGVGNDSLDGRSDDDELEGGLGADTLNGEGNDNGDTAIYSRSGAAVNVNLTTGVGSGGEAAGDVLIGIERLVGSAFNDTLVGNKEDNRFEGGLGADSIVGGEGIDTARYSDSTAAVNVNLATGTGSGGEAAGDVLVGIENVSGSDFNDTLVGNDLDNIIEGRLGADSIVGGLGNDIVDYDSSDFAVNVNLATGVVSGGEAAGDTIVGIESVIASDENDTLTGSSGNNYIDAGRGDDTIFGGAGNDLLDGGRNDDTIFGGTGNDDIQGNRGSDLIYGDPGADTLRGGRRDSVNNLNDNDTVTYVNSNAAVNVSLFARVGFGGYAEGDRLFERVENLTGSNFNDTLEGNSDFNYLSGLGGADSLKGREGEDTLEGGLGADTLDGGSDLDTASYKESTRAVNVDLETGSVSGGDAVGDVFISIENLSGSASDDTLAGDGNANVLKGKDGADLLQGKGNNDTIAGDSGNDTLVGGSGDDLLNGGIGADSIVGGDGVDTVTYENIPEQAPPAINVGVNVNLATGTGSGSEAAGDTFVGVENAIGSDFDDTLIGDSNNNLLEGGSGADTINGGTGNDTASYSNSSDRVNLNLSTGVGIGGQAQGDVLSNIENLVGSVYNDSLIGDRNSNNLSGDRGNDLLEGKGGRDTVFGGLGADTLTGGSGADTLSGEGDKDSLEGGSGTDLLLGGKSDDTLSGGGAGDTVDGGTGIDTASYSSSTNGVNINLLRGTITGGDATGDRLISIENLIGSGSQDTLVGDNGNNVLEGGSGRDTIDGGNGFDTASYHSSAAAVNVNLNNGTASGGDAAGDRLSRIENLVGSNQNDTLTGNTSSNILLGGSGADFLEGFSNSDYLYGGAGADTLEGGSGTDQVNGEDGNDFLKGGSNNDTILGGEGSDTIDTGSDSDYADGEAGADFLEGELGNDTLVGGTENDTLLGNSGNDQLSGGTENDSLNGGADNDWLFGGTGDDTVIGGSGIDTLNGGTGSDSLSGGSGNDFVTGGSGDDTLTGGSGDDILVGIDTYKSTIRNIEVDLFIGSQGSSGSDKIVLGDSAESYYVGFGDSDYARITNLDDGGTNRDSIELFGSATDYRLATGVGNSTEIYHLTGTGTEDLIAVVENITVAGLSDNLVYV